MGLVAPFIPAIAGGIASLFGNKKSDTQTQATAAQQQSAQQQSDLAKSLQDYSGKMFSATQPALTAGMSYYQKLLAGGRSDVQSAIAPDVAGINTAYEGTQKYLEQQGVRGGARDNAIAESERERVGKIGMLPFLARKDAASNLTSIGLSGTSTAIGGMSAAAGAARGSAATSSNLSDQDFYQQQVRGNQIRDLGGSIGKLFSQWMLGKGGGGSNSPGPWSSGYNFG